MMNSEMIDPASIRNMLLEEYKFAQCERLVLSLATRVIWLGLICGAVFVSDVSFIQCYVASIAASAFAYFSHYAILRASRKIDSVGHTLAKFAPEPFRDAYIEARYLSSRGTRLQFLTRLEQVVWLSVFLAALLVQIFPL